VIERVTQHSLEDYMQTHIFQPLGMNSTTFRIADHSELLSRRAQIGRRETPAQTPFSSSNYKPDITSMDPGGVGLYSTASDYSILLSALLDGGSYILSATSTHELLT
jgi:CubicO group peptidase (beta-lactamase class C family)